MLMTWNMHGTGSSGDEKQKWDKLAAWMLTPAWNVQPAAIALQGCGKVPDLLPGVREHVQTFNPGGWSIKTCKWTVNDMRFFVSHAFFDQGARRINLAVVSKSKPRAAITTSDGHKRPAMGVNLDGVWVFSLQAGGALGCRAEQLLSNIQTEVGTGPWVAMGDFNCNPDELAWQEETLEPVVKGCALQRVAPSVPTCPRKDPSRTFDYAVKTDKVLLSQASIVDMDTSDHFAVLFT